MYYNSEDYLCLYVRPPTLHSNHVNDVKRARVTICERNFDRFCGHYVVFSASIMNYDRLYLRS